MPFKKTALKRAKKSPVPPPTLPVLPLSVSMKEFAAVEQILGVLEPYEFEVKKQILGWAEEAAILRQTRVFEGS